MFQIQCNIKKKNGYFTYWEIMIGKGFSNWGQIYWISITEINRDFNGEVTGGTMLWSF